MDTGQGFPEWADLISEKLDELGIYLECTSLNHRVTTCSDVFADVLLTHWHGDHSGGVPDLIAKYPHLVDRIHKHSPEGQQQPIEDGQTFGGISPWVQPIQRNCLLSCLNVM